MYAVYDWLKDYHKIIEELAYLEYNLEATERELKRWIEGDLSKVRLEADSQGSKVEEAIEQIKSDIKFKKEQLASLLTLVESFKGLDNKILKMKYVDGMTLDNISIELGYSSSYIYKRHAEMIRMIKFAEDLQLSLN